MSLSAMLFAGSVIANEPSDWVNPFVGTTNFGTCNPGAVLPNGLMSVSPFNVMGSELNQYDKDARWWSTPYDITNSYLTGFSHVNLSGVGCPEMGSLLVMATTGKLNVDYHQYGSLYSDEKASPGYYSVRLKKYDILAEATATMRSGRLRFSFPKGEANILLNLGEGLTNETGATVRRISDTEIVGSKLLGTFCYTSSAVFPIYFAMRVSKVPNQQGVWKFQRPKKAEAQWDADDSKYKIYKDYTKQMSGDDIGVWMSYNFNKPESIEVSVGVSFVSEENALLNLNTEQPQGMTFDSMHSNARQRWNEDLGRIMVEGGSNEQKHVLYTALYHALIHPNIVNDVNGEYPEMESNKIGKTATNRYTVFSLWDTYRNLHQLMTLLYPERQLDMVRSMVDMSKEWGWLPKWELFGRETFTMEGDPAIPVIIDTWRKGLTDFDIDAAYKAMVKSATTPGAQNKMRPDIDPYLEKGFVPLGAYAADMSGDNSVSHALEYYVADNALAWLAANRGDNKFAADLRKRAAGWKNYFSTESNTLRPVHKDGSFLTPFNPRQGENFEPVPGFHEGSAWNYTFFVPHDIPGLAKIMGGKKKFINTLQRVFDEKLYDPSNEPDIAYPYLFAKFKGEEWRTDKTVKDLLAQYFTNRPNGIPGNDDTGTMSAWAIFSMLGLYPDIPGEPQYTLTLPTFDKVTIKLDKKYYPAGTLTITKAPNAEAGKSIDIKLDGKKIGRTLSHDQLRSATTLSFENQ